MLSTNRDGFAIFSLDSLPAEARTGGGLAVRYGQRPDLTFAVATAGGGTYFAHTLPVGPWLEAEAAAAPGPWHDDGLTPDDVWAIPGVFPDLGDLVFGDDYCGRLIPNDLTVQVARHSQTVRTARNVVTCLKSGESDCHGCEGHVSQGESDGRNIHLHEGELIEFETRCARLGYTFGDLLYSLPLAPCESVTLAVSHWEQRQQARAEQDSVSAQKTNAAYYRENALSEALNAASSSNHRGWAVMTGNSSGSGASGAGTLQKFAIKATAALQANVGASMSSNYDRASYATNATRNFSDRIEQASEAWRQDHQVVIMEQAESEDQQVSYRTVCNNNHCHVLNIFYHEVLNNYRVTTRMLGHREVYFVPYAVKTFDLAMALCARPLLLPFLLEPDLAECYRKLSLAGKEGGAATAPEEVDEFKLDVTVAMVSGSPASHDSGLFLMVRTLDGTLQQFPLAPLQSWSSGQSYSYSIGTPNFDPATIHEVGFLRLIDGAGGLGHFHIVQVQSFTISAKDKVSGQWVPLGSGAVGPTENTILTMTPASYAPPPAADAAAVAEDADCAERLLAHLNCHKTYYNSVLWLLEDPNERFCRFDGIVCGASGTSLADLVIPEPVAVMGCHVAFPKADSVFIPNDAQPIQDERLLTLPTPGIFADAALGRCSACEAKDDNVYWDWKDTPCACGAAAVTLKTPTDSNLFQAGVSPFPSLATTWVTSVSPPAGDGSQASLVGAFGGALAAAMLSGKNSASEMAALQDMLGKMTVALKDMLPKDGGGAGTGAGGTGAGTGGTGGTGTGAGPK
jgi:hypothetical protein